MRPRLIPPFSVSERAKNLPRATRDSKAAKKNATTEKPEIDHKESKMKGPEIVNIQMAIFLAKIQL